MARLILPSAGVDIKMLLDNIIAQNSSLGADSPLPLMLTENEIDLSADKMATASAITLDNAATSLARSAENFTESRDLKTDPAMKAIAGIAQLLKKFYRTKPTELGKWGIAITASGKITYPLSAADKLKLITDIETKYNSFAPDANPHGIPG